MVSVQANSNRQNTYGFIDHSGDFVIPPDYSSVKPFSEGLAVVDTLDGQSMFINRSGKPVIQHRSRIIGLKSISTANGDTGNPRWTTDRLTCWTLNGV